jgi:pyruvate dehydrogenase complex dehydrogenase (E1) component
MCCVVAMFSVATSAMDGAERFHPKDVTLLGSGAILTEVIKAAELLAARAWM